ncbi:MAG: DUF6541 family protein [Chloroflexota bacterium]|nr:DUF6541 family protein [Chloroflexota bacterium]
MSKKTLLIALLALVVVLMTGCVEHVDLDTMQPQTEIDAPPVYGTQLVGQSFTVTKPNVSGITVFGRQTEPTNGPFILHLRHSPTATHDILSATLEGASQRDPTTIHWSFPAQDTVPGTSFYFVIEAPEATVEDPLQLRAVPRDLYQLGQFYVDGQAQTGELAFQVYYDYNFSLVWSDLQSGVQKLWLVFPLLALFWAPGFLLLQLWPQVRQRHDTWEQIALSLGLSLAFIPFSLLWITQLGGQLGTTSARWFYTLLGLAAVSWLLYRRRECQKTETLATPFKWPGVLLTAMLLFGLGVRLLTIRDLALPAWVDSVHHVTLARIIAERGKVPATYRPYVDVGAATYHYGFHAAVAYFSWLSGSNIIQSTLLIGQFYNIAMALQLYLFTRWLTQRRKTALFAALLIALVSNMPAYYVSWGRYTQLSGLLILPVAIILNIETVERRNKKTLALAIFTLAGLILTHYRVLAFYVCFLAAWWLVKFWDTRPEWRMRLREVPQYLGIGLLAGLALMPWLWETATALWLRAFLHWGGSPSASTVLMDFSWYYVSRGIDRYLLTVGVLGAVVALLEKKRFTWVLLIWLGELFIITNPSLVGLPGEGLTNNIAMLITWFIPQAIWSGFILTTLWESWLDALPGREKWCYLALIILLGSLCLVGVSYQLVVLNPECVLALSADREALAWIETHTAPDSYFLINSRRWQGEIYMGTDGGYWITPLTGRRTNVPPALYPLGTRESTVEIKTLNEKLKELYPAPASLWQRLRELGVDYIYLGALGGPLPPQTLHATPGFQLKYDNARVRIYAVTSK